MKRLLVNRWLTAGVSVMLAAGLLGGMVTPAAAAKTPKIDPNATLTFGSVVPAFTWDPIKLANPNSGGQNYHPTYDQLVQLDNEGGVAPMLATSWKSSADGMTWTFKLRNDVKFWDGSPLDANAVKANLDRMKNGAGSLVAPLLSTMTSVTAPDPTTVVVAFSAGNFAYPYLLAGDLRTSSIVNPKGFDDPTLASLPQGSGPYKVTASSPTGITWERVPNHWDKAAGKMAKVVMTYISDGAARLNAFRSGQVMAISGTADQLQDLQQFVTKGSPYNLNLVESTYLMSALEINITKPNVSNPLVRQAMGLVIDRQAIIDVALPGAAKPTTQIFPSLVAGYVPSLDSAKNLKPNVAKAKKLMAEAGVPDGFTLNMVTQNLTLQSNGAQIIQQQLAQIGIKAEITLGDSITSTTAYTQGKYDALFFPLPAGIDPTQIMASSITSGRGFGNPPYLDAAIKEAAVKPLGPARTKAYEDISKTLVEQPVHIMIGNQFTVFPAEKKVLGLDESPYSHISSILDIRNLSIAK